MSDIKRNKVIYMDNLRQPSVNMGHRDIVGYGGLRPKPSNYPPLVLTRSNSNLNLPFRPRPSEFSPWKPNSHPPEDNIIQALAIIQKSAFNARTTKRGIQSPKPHTQMGHSLESEEPDSSLYLGTNAVASKSVSELNALSTNASTTFISTTISDDVNIIVTADLANYPTVNISRASSASTIRERISQKLSTFISNDSFFIYHIGNGACALGLPLTDSQLFDICCDQAYAEGTLKFFVTDSLTSAQNYWLKLNSSAVTTSSRAPVEDSESSLRASKILRRPPAPSGGHESRETTSSALLPHSDLADNSLPSEDRTDPHPRTPRKIFQISSSPSQNPDYSRMPWSDRAAEQIIFQNLVTFLANELATAQGGLHDKIAYHDEFQDYLDYMVDKDRVSCLVGTDECRSTLLRISKSLGLSSQSGIREALRKDEEQLVDLLREVVNSSYEKEQVLSLKGNMAHTFLDFLQLILSKGLLDASGATRKARRLFVKLSLKANIILPSQIISGLTMLNNGQPVNGGGYADIFKAVFQGQEVAVKRIRTYLRKDSQKIRRAFSQEALVWQHLKHPNVLPFLGIDREMFTSALCMVSPWMNNGTILNFREEIGPSNMLIESRLIEIADGLSYLHAEGVIHGDLRGGNILIDDDWHAILADFGLTTFGDATMSAVTQDTNPRGTTRWMAPELLIPDDEDDSTGLQKTEASDVYAFGCVCLELYTGRPPFSETTNETAVVYQLLQGKRPSSKALREDAQVKVTSHILELVEKCWNRVPKERPRSKDVLNLLK